MQAEPLPPTDGPLARGYDRAVGDVGPDSGRVNAPATRRAAPEWSVVAASWLVGELVFFRSQWLSGFDRVMGDPGAARFLVYVNENWYQALLGRASWRDPAFYFPLGDTLGRSDTLLLWQLVYAPARALGADPFLAFQVVLVTLSAVGFVTFYLVVRTLWHPPVGVGVAGAALFAFSNALYANANHAQLFGVLLVPAVALLCVAAWRATSAGSRAGIAWGAAAAALGVLVLYSTYYVGFFSLLAVAVAALCSLAVTPRVTLGRVVRGVRRGWPTLAGAAVGAAGPGALFAVTYLPGLHASGGYDVAAARFFAPRVSDLVNVGTGNLLWGTALARAVVHGVAATGERDYAITPVLLVTALVVAVAATVVERRRPPVERRYACGVLAATGVSLCLLPLDVGGTFVWSAVAWVPGATGIRAVDRVAVVGGGVIVLSLVAGTAQLLRATSLSRRRLAIVLAAIALSAACVEQVNVSNVAELSRAGQVASLNAVPAPPASCRSFFVETATASLAHPARTQTFAMLLSVRFDLPTLNGTSGSFPPGWRLFYPSRPGYASSVASWVHSHHLLHVCALDLDDDTWRRHGLGSP